MSKLLLFDADGNKRCSTCKLYIPVTLFNRDKKGPNGLSWCCKRCTSERTKRLHNTVYKHNPKYKINAKNYSLKRKYGISYDEYMVLLSSQNNRCAICKTDSPKGGWHLDHCHNTNKVRGILCNPCNRGIGYLQDSAELLKEAARYLGER